MPIFPIVFACADVAQCEGQAAGGTGAHMVAPAGSRLYRGLATRFAVAADCQSAIQPVANRRYGLSPSLAIARGTGRELEWRQAV